MASVKTTTENLRDLLPPGSTMTTNVANVRDGMRWAVRCFADLNGQPLDVSHMVAAVLGLKCDKAGRVRVSGGGMDMGFHTVYTLSATLYGWEDRGGYNIKHRRG
jgi:hypothetical protein